MADIHTMTNSYELQPFQKIIEGASSLIYPSCQWSASCFNALCDDDFLRQGVCLHKSSSRHHTDIGAGSVEPGTISVLLKDPIGRQKYLLALKLCCFCS